MVDRRSTANGTVLNRTPSIAALAAALLILGGCGGSAATQPPSPTQPSGPGATTATGGEVPAAGAPTQGSDGQGGTGGNGGDGGNGSKPAGWDQYGKVHVDISGPATKSADYGFVPAGSLFGGAQGSSLNFGITGTDEIVSILIGADGSVVVSYGGPDFSMPGTTCTTSNWNVGATSGSGSFDCTAAITILNSGASVQGGTIKGTFDAHG